MKGKVVTDRQKELIASKLRGHPSSMKGKKQRPESIAQTLRTKQANFKPASAERRAEMRQTMLDCIAQGKWIKPKLAGMGRKGFREDVAIFARSSWEANIARWLQHLKLTWEYEPEPFALSNGSRYTPDFRLANGRVIEVKGHWWPKSRERFEQFRADYPHIGITLITKRVYRHLERRFRSHIPNWEAS